MGAGLYVTGGVATVLIVLFQVILHRSSPLVKTQRTGTVVLELSEAESDPAEVRRLLEERVSAVEGVRVTRLADGRAEVKCDVRFPAGYTAEDILRYHRAQEVDSRLMPIKDIITIIDEI